MDRDERISRLMSTLEQGAARGSAANLPTAPTASGASWTIPLQVSVSLGTAMPGQPAVAPIHAAPAEGLFGGGAPAITVDTVSEFSIDSLTATDFDWSAALSLALASRLSYAGRDEVRATAIDGWGMESCEFIEAVDTQCFVAISPDAALVAFRGTESAADWIADFNALSTSTSYGTVHRGFYHAFQDAREQLRQALLLAGQRPVLITGHSLGGALATVAAAEWRGLFPVRFVYTYGQPRVGFADFQAAFDAHYADSFFRFVNDDDIVTRVPPGYRHVGQLFHFDSEGVLEQAVEAAGLEIASPEPPPLTESQFDQLRAQLLQARSLSRAVGTTESMAALQLEGVLPSFSDHRLDRYIAAISGHARDDDI